MSTSYTILLMNDGSYDAFPSGNVERELSHANRGLTGQEAEATVHASGFTLAEARQECQRLNDAR